MKKLILSLAISFLSVQAFSEVTCVGQVGNMNTRINIINQNDRFVQIDQAVGFLYISRKAFSLGKSEMDIFGTAIGSSGGELSYVIKFNKNSQNNDLTANVIFNNSKKPGEQSGLLNCIDIGKTIHE